MNMIEKVARALARQTLTDLGKQAFDRLPDYYNKDFSSRERKEFEAQARAAIKAMREPTEGMKTCSEEIYWGYSCHVCGGLKEGWQSMIDAALKE